MSGKKITISRPFEKAFAKLPKEIQEATYRKLDLLVANPLHPSLRVKKIKGTDSIWEMSITMNYRVTFEHRPDELFLRYIGTHDILKRTNH